MAKVDEIAQGFVQLRFDRAELEGPSALQAPVPVICFPTEYPHRNCAAVKVMSICQGGHSVSEDKSMRFSLPTAHLLTLHGHGNGFREDLLHPSLPTASAGSKVLLSFIPGTDTAE